VLFYQTPSWRQVFEIARRREPLAHDLLGLSQLQQESMMQGFLDLVDDSFRQNAETELAELTQAHDLFAHQLSDWLVQTSEGYREIANAEEAAIERQQELARATQEYRSQVAVAQALDAGAGQNGLPQRQRKLGEPRARFDVRLLVECKNGSMHGRSLK